MNTTSKETVEEAANNYVKTFRGTPKDRRIAFIAGAKWRSEQQPKGFSREEIVLMVGEWISDRSEYPYFGDWFDKHYPAK